MKIYIVKEIENGFIITVRDQVHSGYNSNEAIYVATNMDDVGEIFLELDHDAKQGREKA